MSDIKKELLICNKCGQPIGNKELPKTDYLRVRKEWGYFSKKDLVIHEFNLCENCYDKMIENFTIAPQVLKKNEVI